MLHNGRRIGLKISLQSAEKLRRMLKFYLIICALVFALAYLLGFSFRPVSGQENEVTILQNKEFAIGLEKVEKSSAAKNSNPSVLELLDGISKSKDAGEQKKLWQEAVANLRKNSDRESVALFQHLEKSGLALDVLERARALLLLSAGVPANRARVREEALHDLVSQPVPLDRSPAEFRSLQDQNEALSESAQKNSAILTYEALADSATPAQILDDTFQVLRSQPNQMVRREIVFRLLDVNADYANSVFSSNPAIWTEVFGPNTYPKVDNGKYYVVKTQ